MLPLSNVTMLTGKIPVSLVHSYCLEFLRTLSLSCPEEIITQKWFYSSDSFNISTSYSRMFPVSCVINFWICVSHHLSAFWSFLFSSLYMLDINLLLYYGCQRFSPVLQVTPLLNRLLPLLHRNFFGFVWSHLPMASLIWLVELLLRMFLPMSA